MHRTTRTTVTVGRRRHSSSARWRSSGVPGAGGAPAPPRPLGGTAAAGARAPQAVAVGDGTPGPRVLTTRPGRPLARPSGLAADASPATPSRTAVVDRAGRRARCCAARLRTGSVRPALGGGTSSGCSRPSTGCPSSAARSSSTSTRPAAPARPSARPSPGAAPSTSPRITPRRGGREHRGSRREVHEAQPVSSLVVTDADAGRSTTRRCSVPRRFPVPPAPASCGGPR